MADTYHCELYQGQIHLAECDLEAALDCFRRMRERDPENWLVWAAYADEMARLCRYDEALENYERAMPLRPKPRFVDCEESVAQIHEIRGERAGAARMHRRIVQILGEDWGVTEGEAVDAHLREIARLEGRT